MTRNCLKVSKSLMTYKHRESFSSTLFLVHVTSASRATTRQHNVIGWPTSTDSDWLYIVGWPSFITTPVSSCSNWDNALSSALCSCCNKHMQLNCNRILKHKHTIYHNQTWYNLNVHRLVQPLPPTVFASLPPTPPSLELTPIWHSCLFVITHISSTS